MSFQSNAFQNDAFQIGGADTHDGFDEDSHLLVKEEHARKEKDFRSRRERLRAVLTQAWEGPGPVGAEVKALASPFVEVLESGSLRIDHAALEARNRKVMEELLAFEGALRAEYQAARAEEDEEDVMLLTWN